MKSIKEQYKSLQEGRISQFNFMRSLRMSLPQYITNVTSYKDSIKILKNKGILTEGEIDDIQGIGDDNMTDTMHLLFNGDFDNNPEELERIKQELEFSDHADKEMALVLINDKLNSVSQENNIDPENDETGINPVFDKTDNFDGMFEDLVGQKIAGNPEEEAASRSTLIKNYNMNPEQLRIGIDTEMEHTNDRTVAEKIAIDHLKEDPEYYTKLTSAGLEEGTITDIEADEIAEQAESYEDAVCQLEDKGVPTEKAERIASRIKGSVHMRKLAKDINTPLKEAKEGKAVDISGKQQYAHFKEIDNANSQELLIGIDCEMQKNPALTKAQAAKNALRNIKKIPNYYTMAYLAGKEGAEPQYDKGIKPEDWQMKPVKGGSMNDKALGMKPIKNMGNAKADANKATKETNTIVKGVKELTFTAKTVRGLKKFDPTGSKTKTIREVVDQALAKERLKKIIREELKNIKK